MATADASSSAPAATGVADDVPPLASEPTLQDLVDCNSSIEKIESTQTESAAPTRDPDLLASEYVRGAMLFFAWGNNKDALSAWRAAFKISPSRTVAVLRQLFAEEQFKRLEFMLTSALPVLLKTDPQKGRHFVSRDQLAEGRSVFFEYPYIWALEDRSLGKNCDNCLAPVHSDRRRQCAQCGLASYCSEACQLAGSYYHATECSVLGRLGASITLLPNTRDLRLLLRLITRRRLEARQGKLLARGSQFKDFLGLLSHRQSASPAALESYKTLWGILAHVLPPEDVPSPDDVVEWSTRIAANMHALTFSSPDLSSGVRLNEHGQLMNTNPEVGVAIFPGISIFNHSCIPNCVWLTRGGNDTAEVFAQRAVKLGEELTVAYVDISLPLAERRRLLKEKYFFDCKCKRCSDDEKGGVYRPPSTVQTCAGCGVRKANLLRCGRCHASYYCTAACQKAHWAAHKPGCKAAP